jgi:hypothetical protein
MRSVARQEEEGERGLGDLEGRSENGDKRTED